jgi:hypothetical protein
MVHRVDINTIGKQSHCTGLSPDHWPTTRTLRKNGQYVNPPLDNPVMIY